MRTFEGLRLTLPERHFDATQVMQKRWAKLHALFNATYDVMSTPRMSDITDYLKIHNRTALTFEQRYDRCHQLLARIMSSAGELQDLLPHKELSLLHTETTFAVKLLLQETIEADTVLSQQYLHWLVFCLSQQIASQFANYHNEPKSLWGELHRVYQFVLDQGIEHKFAFPLTATIGQTYQSIVFFAAAEPHHLDATDSGILLNWLRVWMPRDSMTVLSSHETSRHQFYVNLLENRGVLSDKRVQEFLVHDHSILVAEPKPLIEIAKAHIAMLHANGIIDDIKLQLNVDSIDIICALKKAIMSWGKITDRKEVRIRSYESVELVVGLPYVLQILNSHSNKRLNCVNGVAINSSKGGTCVEISSKDIINTNVGDIVSEKSAKNESFVGVVKWIKKAPGSAQMGIEFLLGNPRSVQTTVSDHWVNGLFMHEGTNEVLLTRSGTYHAGQNVRISDHDHNKTVVANLGPLLNRFGNTDVFRVFLE